MSTVTRQMEPKLNRDALAAMYEETFRNFEEGTITEGRIVALTKDKVVVDIGYKSEGMIPSDQFSAEELQQVKVGDRLQVYIEECEDADGNLVLSKEKADKMKIWEELEKLHKEEKSIEGKIICREGHGTLPIILRARQRIVCLELQIVRQSTISLKHKRMVFRIHIATNFSDLRKIRVRSRSSKRVSLRSSHEDWGQVIGTS